MLRLIHYNLENANLPESLRFSYNFSNLNHNVKEIQLLTSGSGHLVIIQPDFPEKHRLIVRPAVESLKTVLDAQIS